MKKIPKNTYKKIMENIPILCVDIILKKGKKILLVKRKNKPLKDVWWIPGGRVFKNETLIDAVKRKCMEELNINVEKIKEIGTYEYIGQDPFFETIKTGVHTVSVVYLMNYISGEIKVDRNHECFKWFEIKDCSKELKRILDSLKMK